MRRFFDIVLVASMLFIAAGAFQEVRGDEIKQRGWVTDDAKVLTVDQTNALSNRLANIEKTKPDAPQVVIVTYKSLGGDAISDKTIQLGKAWKVGRQERDNGVIIAIAPVERKYFIAVGYGLEPSIPDSKTQAIGEKMRSALQKNKTDWNAALIAAVDSVETMLPIEAYDPANPIKKPVSVTAPIHHPIHGWALVGILAGIGIFGIVIWFVFFRKTRDQRVSSSSSYGNGTYGNGTYGSGTYPRQRDNTTVVVVESPSYSSRSRSDDSPSRSSSYSSSSDYSSSSSSSSDSGSSYSSGGGDFGGGGGGGDL